MTGLESTKQSMVRKLRTKVAWFVKTSASQATCRAYDMLSTTLLPLKLVLPSVFGPLSKEATLTTDRSLRILFTSVSRSIIQPIRPAKKLSNSSKMTVLKASASTTGARWMSCQARLMTDLSRTIRSFCTGLSIRSIPKLALKCSTVGSISLPCFNG